MAGRTPAVVLAAAAVLGSGSALGGACHPDPVGTRTLVVHGQVTGYVVHGTQIRLGFRDAQGCAHRVSWNAATAPAHRAVTPTGRRCRSLARLGDSFRVPDLPGSVTAAAGNRHAAVGVATITLFAGTRRTATIRRSTQELPLKAILRGSRLVVLTRGSRAGDKPDRLEVYDTVTRRSLGSWPLVEPAATLDLYGDTVVFATVGRLGVYALRLSDGATRVVGPAWVGDTPQIESAGVVYEDGTYDRDRAGHRVPVKFIPSNALAWDFAHTFRHLRTDGAVTGLALDGPNLAVTFRGSARECDQVKIWQVYWQDVAKPTMEHGAGCVAGDAIRGVAETGIVAHWIADIGGTQRLVWSSSKNCVQHLVAQMSGSDRLVAVAGSRGLVAYTIRHDDGTATLVTARAHAMSNDARMEFEQAPKAIVSDGDRLAVLRADGKVSVLTGAREVAATFDVGDADAVALRGDRLLTTTERRLEEYSVATGRRVAGWTLGGRATSVSVRFGIAVVTVGHDVVALRLADGARIKLAHTTGPALAAIDSAGAAYASAGSAHGVTFIPMADVERAFVAR